MRRAFFFISRRGVLERGLLRRVLAQLSTYVVVVFCLSTDFARKIKIMYDRGGGHRVALLVGFSRIAGQEVFCGDERR